METDMESEDIFADESAQLEGEEEEEEELTALEVLERLETAWTNEKFSPELLPPSSDVVECLLSRLSELESSEEKLSPLEAPIRSMEVSRIRYLLSDYLRIRLDKIQSFPLHCKEDHLSQEERDFLKAYKSNVSSLFRRTVGQGMPGDFGEDQSKIFPQEAPHHLDQTVFIAVLEDVEGCLLRDETGGERDEHIDLLKGSQHILRYKDVRELLQKGAVKLI
eukprot:TRINITY_DN4562_c0_g1_i1.p1 TRINITY_DN4562_c0_g1~~TRINITY_DN4562_c0_g1_i1.p1  ORF type:complete len:221 (-),score=92.58 TRINITY_DN4562_c0_g1_i1:724-1386(-)